MLLHTSVRLSFFLMRERDKSAIILLRSLHWSVLENTGGYLFSNRDMKVIETIACFMATSIEIFGCNI